LRDPILCVRDRGGRRSGSERRKFSILEYAPERRSGRERRGNPERRNGKGSTEAIYWKRDADRYVEFAKYPERAVPRLFVELASVGPDRIHDYK